MERIEKDVIIIGGGLTGLTTALQLKKKGLTVALLEKSDRTGDKSPPTANRVFSLSRVPIPAPVPRRR